MLILLIPEYSFLRNLLISGCLIQVLISMLNALFLELDKSWYRKTFPNLGHKRYSCFSSSRTHKIHLLLPGGSILQPPPILCNKFLKPGDTAYIKLLKPFLSTDVFAFTSATQHIDNGLARMQLDQIKVVPNPYMGSAQWEIKNPYTSGRGPRSLHFTHLPSQCTLRIFTVGGELVQQI